MTTHKRRRTAHGAEAGRARPGYHDLTAGIAGAAPARSALTLRLVLAGFGLVVCTAAAVALFVTKNDGFAWAMAALALVAAVDLIVIIHRKGRGEPG